MAYGNWSGEQTKVVWSKVSQYNASSTVYSTTVHWKYRQDNAANKTQIEVIKIVFRQHLVTQGWGMSGCNLNYGVGFSDAKTEATQMLSAKEYWTLSCGRQKEFQHDSSGNFSGQIYWKCSVASSDSHRPTQSSYTSFTPSIPKLTPLSTLTLDKSSVDAGGTIKFTTSNNSGQTYGLYYSWYGTKHQISANAGAGLTWTVPTSLMNQMSSTTSNGIVFTLETWSGGVHLGDVTKACTITVPSSVVPTINSIVPAETVKIGNDLLTAKFGAYLQGKSRPKVDVSASGAYGSWITGISITCEGVTYSGSGITINTLSGSGARDIHVTVTDSRGRQAKKTIQITALAYSDPAVSKFQITRCNASGTAQDDGTCVKIVYSFNITALNSKNSKSLSLQYLNGSTWTNLKTDCAASTYSATNAFYVSGSLFSVDNSYQLRAVITDSFGTKTVSGSVSPSFSLINWGSGGKSMAIGMVSSNDGSFEVGIPTKLYDTLNGVTISKSSWVAVPYASGFRTYDGGLPLQVKKVNHVVEIRGEVTCTVNQNYGNDTTVLVGTLPEGYRPSSIVQFLCQGSVACIFLTRIQADGKIFLDRYRSTDANGGAHRNPISAGTWLTIHQCFINE